MAVRAPQDSDSTVCLDDLAVARINLQIALATSSTYRRHPHGGGWPLAHGFPARTVPAAVLVLLTACLGRPRPRIGTTFDPRRYVPVYLCRVNRRDYR